MCGLLLFVLCQQQLDVIGDVLYCPIEILLNFEPGTKVCHIFAGFPCFLSRQMNDKTQEEIENNAFSWAILVQGLHSHTRRVRNNFPCFYGTGTKLKCTTFFYNQKLCSEGSVDASIQSTLFTFRVFSFVCVLVVIFNIKSRKSQSIPSWQKKMLMWG